MTDDPNQRGASGAPDASAVARTAALARLALDEREVAELTPQFARILAAFEALRAVDVAGVEPMTRPFEPAASDARPIGRADEPGPCLARDAALAGAPKRADAFYAVPKTVDAEG